MWTLMVFALIRRQELLWLLWHWGRMERGSSCFIEIPVQICCWRSQNWIWVWSSRLRYFIMDPLAWYQSHADQLTWLPWKLLEIMVLCSPMIQMWGCPCGLLRRLLDLGSRAYGLMRTSSRYNFFKFSLHFLEA